MSGGDEPFRIVRLVDLEAAGAAVAPLLRGIVRIFRESAARWPDDPAAADAFQELWLEQYIRLERDLVWLAVHRDEPGCVAGYLVGCRIDPALSSRFASLDYFKAFASLTATFPAHLHINVDATHRNQHVGKRLVEAFCAQLRGEGVAGVHVVTGRDQRNVHFYQHLGFSELGATPRGKAEVLFLARRP